MASLSGQCFDVDEFSYGENFGILAEQGCGLVVVLGNGFGDKSQAVEGCEVHDSFDQAVGRPWLR